MRYFVSLYVIMYCLVFFCHFMLLFIILNLFDLFRVTLSFVTIVPGVSFISVVCAVCASWCLSVFASYCILFYLHCHLVGIYRIFVELSLL